MFHFKPNRKYTQISIYVVLTVIAIYLVIAAGSNISDILSFLKKGLGFLSQVFTPLLIGFVIAYLLKPVVEKVESSLRNVSYFKEKKKLTHQLSVAITSLIVLFVFALLSIFVIKSIGKELAVTRFKDMSDFLRIVAKNVNAIYEAIIVQLKSMSISTVQVQQFLKTAVNSVTSNLLGGITKVSDFFTNLLFSIIFAIYFMLDGEKLWNYWSKSIKAFTSRKVDIVIHQLLIDIEGVFSCYVRGQVIDAFLMFVMVSVAFGFLHVKFWIVIALLVGIGNLIPYVGPFLGYGSIAIIGLVTADLHMALRALIALLIIQGVDGNIINPRLLSASIDIHPVLVIVSLIFGSMIGGFLGMLVSVPVGALCKIWFERLVEYRSETKNELVEEKENGI